MDRLPGAHALRAPPGLGSSDCLALT